MKFLKPTLRLIIFLGAISLSTKLWVKFNSSFRFDKMKPKDFFVNHFQVEDVEDINLNDIVSQKYTLLSKGRQSFVFVSEDDKYVIKFFRSHRYDLPIFYTLLDNLSIMKEYISNKRKELHELYLENMKSYRLAYECLKHQTGVVYVHLNQSSNIKTNIQIEDKFGQKYFINLDDFGFVIQKKTKGFIPTILNLKNDIVATEKLLAAFFDNLNEIYKKNILNKDRHVLQNLGVLENKVLEIDIGRFITNEKMQNKEVLKDEVYHYTVYLRKWFSKNIPEAVPIIDKHLIKLINKDENAKK